MPGFHSDLGFLPSSQSSPPPPPPPSPRMDCFWLLLANHRVLDITASKRLLNSRILTEVHSITVTDWPVVIDNIYNAIRQFCSLYTYIQNFIKCTEVSSGPSITMRISLARLMSLSLLRRRVFTNFIWLKERYCSCYHRKGNKISNNLNNPSVCF